MVLIFLSLYQLSYLNSIGFFSILSFHLLFSLPAIYMHISYSIRNAGDKIELNSTDLILERKGFIKVFNYREIKRIVVYRSQSINQSGKIPSINSYQFARLTTKSEDEIIITCLMTLNLEEIISKIPGVTHERKKGFAFLFRK